MNNEELPCGVLALRSQILHSSFFIKSPFFIKIYSCSTPIIVNCMRFRSASTLSIFTRTC